MWVLGAGCAWRCDARELVLPWAVSPLAGHKKGFNTRCARRTPKHTPRNARQCLSVACSQAWEKYRADARKANSKPPTCSTRSSAVKRASPSQARHAKVVSISKSCGTISCLQDAPMCSLERRAMMIALSSANAERVASVNATTGLSGATQMQKAWAAGLVRCMGIRGRSWQWLRGQAVAS